MTKFSRSILFALVAILVCFGTALGGYLVSTVIGKVEVKETIFVEPAGFEMGLYPNDEQVEELVITNKGKTDINVALAATVAPVNLGVKVKIDGGPTILVKGNSQVAVPVVVTSSAGVVPGKYVVTITVVR